MCQFRIFFFKYLLKWELFVAENQWLSCGTIMGENTIWSKLIIKILWISIRRLCRQMWGGSSFYSATPHTFRAWSSSPASPGSWMSCIPASSSSSHMENTVRTGEMIILVPLLPKSSSDVGPYLQPPPSSPQHLQLTPSIPLHLLTFSEPTFFLCTLLRPFLFHLHNTSPPPPSILH